MVSIDVKQREARGWPAAPAAEEVLGTYCRQCDSDDNPQNLHMVHAWLRRIHYLVMETYNHHHFTTVLCGYYHTISLPGNCFAISFWRSDVRGERVQGFDSSCVWESKMAARAMRMMKANGCRPGFNMGKRAPLSLYFESLPYWL